LPESPTAHLESLVERLDAKLDTLTTSIQSLVASQAVTADKLARLEKLEARVRALEIGQARATGIGVGIGSAVSLAVSVVLKFLAS
jgi:hypothetical protein